MASNQQQADTRFPFGIGAGGVCGGVPPISDPRARAAMQHQAVGSQFQLGHPAPMQPQVPTVSAAAGFQHGSGAETQGDNRLGRAERSSTVRPLSMRPSTRRFRSRDRTGTAGPSLTAASPQPRGEWEDQIADLPNRMLTIERKHRDLAQAVAAQDQIPDGYRRGCTQILEKITTLDQYAQAVDARFNEVDNHIPGEMSTGRNQLRALERIVS